LVGSEQAIITGIAAKHRAYKTSKFQEDEMPAGKGTVSGSQVSGALNITGGSEHINGQVATLADDVTSINTATQNALTLPDDYKNGRKGYWGKIVGGAASDGGF
jgi:hypothetical protein